MIGGVRALMAAALVAAAPGYAAAQAPAAPSAAETQAGALLVTGPSGQSVALGRAELDQLPAVTVSLAREHAAPAEYAGPALWAVLDRAGAISQEPRSHVHQAVAVTGRDGYTVVLAMGELDPSFEGKSVIVATKADGKPIGAGELRLVVPGDKRPGRSVRDPVKIVVR